MQLALTGSNMFFGVAAINYGSVLRTETLMLTKESNSFREGAHRLKQGDEINANLILIKELETLS